MKNTYELLNRFESCNTKMVTVIINGAACVMAESDYKRMINAERKYYNIRIKE